MNKSMEEMKRYIKQAGIADENLSDDQVTEFYSVVKVSEETRQDEENSRIMNQSLDEEEIIKLSQSSCEIVSCELPEREKVETKSKKYKSQQKSQQNEDHDINSNNNNNNHSKTSKSNEKSEMKSEMSLIKRKVIIKHPLIQSEEFLASSVDERFKMLKEYYDNRDKRLNELARRSLRFAPLPAPIKLPIINGKYEIESAGSSSYNSNDGEDVAFTRSGRQIRKRRLQLYNEDEDSLDGFTIKKSKSDDEDESNGEWPPASQNKRTNSKKNEKKNVESEKKNVENEKKKMENEKKNVEIKSTELKSQKSRTNLILEQLKLANEKDDKKRQQMEEFDKSISIEDVEDSSEKEKMVVDDSETAIRSGVPTIAKRKPLDRHKSAQKMEYLPIRKQKIPKKTTEVENNNSDKKEQIDNLCPICSKVIPKNFLERHVQKCLDNTSNKEKITINFTDTYSVPVSCSACDEVFLTTESFESHKEKCFGN